MEKLKGKKAYKVFHLAHHDDYDRFFEAIVTVKKHENVFNSGTALRIVCELALERMAELLAEEARDEENKETGGTKSA